jgi:hypothetical protein
MNFEALTQKHLNNLKANIQSVMASKNIYNSGQASESLEVVDNKLLGNHYIYYLDKGSAPWSNPGNYKALGYILTKNGWAKINPYAAAWAIAHKGSQIFQNNSKGIELDMLVDNMLDELIKELPDEAAVEALKWL